MELYSTARSENYFKDPLEMKPERWLRENKDEHHAFSNLQFGFGSRMCLGEKNDYLNKSVSVERVIARKLTRGNMISFASRAYTLIAIGNGRPQV